MALKLRDYQEKAHELMIENFKLNKKVLLSVMAGGGKSITAGAFIAKYRKFYKFVLIVRKRDLVEQLAADALDTFGLDYSVFMANHPKLDLQKSIQVCSKDTMGARDILPFCGVENVVVMVDECDEFPDFQRKIIYEYSKTNRFFYFGMTATAYNKLDFFDVCIEPITPKQLLKKGILIPFKYFIPKKINYSDVEIVDGAWRQADIIKKLDHPKAIADSFAAWQSYGEDRQTLIFCINKAHSKRVAEYINNYYQKEVAAHCDAETPSEDRKKTIDKFKRGEIKFISNIRLFTRGTNIVEIGTILDLAPTLSQNLHIQKLGRGSRKNDFYPDCIVIDMANNVLTNGAGHFYMDRKIDLTSDYKKKKSELETQMMRVCDSCFRAADPSDFGTKNICPYCGFKNKPEKKKKLSKYQQKKIFMASASEEEIEQVKIINDFKKTLWKKKNIGKRYRHDIAKEFAHIDLLKKYGADKVIKVRKTIGLKDTTIERFKRENNYVPLGGLDV